ncbi:MAG TPA: type VII secretion-associated protein [Pseudonocardia sp.]|uniref:type VII secretion-associated protein n=1 Tax=Pseudonocardia sp. TaxID=60912 RepID=UPI002ED87341
MRLAVELGSSPVRLAAADGPGGAPRLLPGRSASSASQVVRAALRRLASVVDPLEELVVVHPAHWTPRAAATAARRLAGPGVPVRARSSALAAAREVAARRRLPPGPLGVLQVGPYGACATVLAGAGAGTAAGACATVLAGAGDGAGTAAGAGACAVAGTPAGAGAGAVLACRHSPTSDDDHPVRLLAEAAAEARVPPPELTAGVLLLAVAVPTERLIEWITDLIGERPLVPTDPEHVAVLGALRADPEPETPPALPAYLRASRPGPAPRPLAAELLPPPPAPRRVRGALAGLAVSLLAAALTAVGSGGLARTSGAPVGHQPAESVPTEGSNHLLAQYDYTLGVPAGWRHSGGLPERRRSLLTPVGTPNGSDLIAVEQTPLGYDSAAEPDRAFRELRDRYQRAVDDGEPLAEFTLATRVADRNVIAYRQRQPRLGTDVQWYVLFERDAQLSVGCQHTPAGADTVRAACVEVLGSLRLRSPTAR